MPTINQLKDKVKAGGKEWDRLTKVSGGKVAVESSQVDDAHNGHDLVAYFVTPGTDASTYPHFTVRYRIDQSIVDVHLSMLSGSSLWYKFGTEFSASPGFQGTIQYRNEKAHWAVLALNDFLFTNMIIMQKDLLLKGLDTVIPEEEKPDLSAAAFPALGAAAPPQRKGNRWK